MSCPDLSQVLCAHTPNRADVNNSREGPGTPMLRHTRKRSSFHNSAGLVTLNVYATKVCLRFPSETPSPDPAIFYSTPGSPPKSPENVKKRCKTREVTAVNSEQPSCELIDVSDFKCECDEVSDLESDSISVSCQDFTWYDL